MLKQSVRRLAAVTQHVQQVPRRYVSSGKEQYLNKLPEDIVIVSALRTPFTRATKGPLAKTSPEELLTAILKATISRTGIDPKEVREVSVGAVLQQLGGQKVSAMAVKNAGFPSTTTTHTVNRQCASSSQSLMIVASMIKLGVYEVGIAAGVESMSLDYFPHRGIPVRVADTLRNSEYQESQDVIVPMGITSENVAAKYGITREDQDHFAMQSQAKAAAAQDRGFFSREIVPIKARQVNEENGQETWIEVSKDDGVRAGVTMEKLAKLPSAFVKDGTTTAGNSSQITDGASAMLVMSRKKAVELGLKPVGKFVQSVMVGVPAALMGIAPAHAVPELLRVTGLSKDDIDVYELNEAFASQSVYCIREVGLDPAKVNPNGGAIAIGHPLGATGGRLIATVLAELQDKPGGFGVTSMCASSGQGMATLVVRE